MTKARRGSKQSNISNGIATDVKLKKFSLPWFLQHWEAWAIVLILVAAACIRYRLLDVPLQRDEGEYAYAGQLLLQGVPPYQWAYNMKLPGIYAVYALILAVFGQTVWGIHAGLLVTNIFSTYLLYRLGKMLSGPSVGIAAAAFFALISCSIVVEGFSANAEHFLLLPILMGLLLLLRAIHSGRGCLFFASGLLFGAGFLIKQHAVAFILFAGVYLLIDNLWNRSITWKRMGVQLVLFATGVFIPYVLTCLILYIAGTFETFWFWTVEYAAEYTNRVTFEQGLERLGFKMGQLHAAAPSLWWLAALGLLSLPWNRTMRPKRFFLTLLVIFSFIAICPGFLFRPHYFLLILPAGALLCGAALALLSQWFTRQKLGWVPVVLAVACFVAFVIGQRDLFFSMTPEQVSRKTYGINPFIEVQRVAEYIRENSEPDDRIAVFGSEPEIYFHSQRRSATGYIYMYAMMEKQRFALRMQHEMISEIESVKPEYLVCVNVPHSWLGTSSSPTKLLDWYRQYSQQHYESVGLVELRGEMSLFHFVPEQLPMSPGTEHWIAILRRLQKEPMDK